MAIGSGSTLPTAAGTLAAALVFVPLRSRFQTLVDRRFDRARYEGLRNVDRYLEELRAGRAAPEATGSVMADAVGDPSLELFFWLPAEEVHVDASGHVVHGLPGGDRVHTPVRRGQLPLATVVHDRTLAERPDLLESVIEAAGLAIEIARLRVEVRRRLAEVEESRARIVSAGYEERRRLERDLHDGTQQRLVSIGLALRHVQGRLPTPSREADELDASVAELGDAIEELRELARGSGPPASTTAWPRRCASSRHARRCASGSRPPSSASTTAWKPRPTSSRARRSPTRQSTRTPCRSSSAPGG
jgi:signal transduction histidine kinase